jgi:prenyltransferase beta subunit
LLSIFVFVPPVPGQEATQRKKAAVEYILKLEAPDGGFLPAQPAPEDRGKTKSSLRALSSALRALKYLGGDAPRTFTYSQFMKSCYDKEIGGFADHPGEKPTVATTAVGLMAAVELKAPLYLFQGGAIRFLLENAKTFEDIRIAAAGLEAISRLPPPAKAWLRQVAALRNLDGTYGKDDGMARETGSAVVVVLRLGGEVEQRDNVVQALKKGQRSDGAFGKEKAPTSDLETTYRVMRAFVMLKEKPNDVAALQAFIDKCQNADGGYGLAPGQPSSLSATYFAAITQHWLAEAKR